MIWKELKTGDKLTVAVPHGDGKYDIQISNVIQCKKFSETSKSYYLKFKYTNTNGKRTRCVCLVHESLERPVNFIGDYKNLTESMNPDSLIICCEENEALVKEAIYSVNAFMIAKYEKQIRELQERVETLKHIEL